MLILRTLFRPGAPPTQPLNPLLFQSHSLPFFHRFRTERFLVEGDRGGVPLSQYGSILSHAEL